MQCDVIEQDMIDTFIDGHVHFEALETFTHSVIWLVVYRKAAMFFSELSEIDVDCLLNDKVTRCW